MALVTFDFQSKCLGRGVSVNAIVPFDGDGATPYKTLYLLHGLTGDKNDWLLKTRLYDLAQQKNLAVIMPSGENSFYLDNDDTKEAYGEFVGRELPDVSRRLFRLSARREDTFIAGLSMGGYGAIRNGLKYHDVFGSLAGESAALLTELDDPGRPAEADAATFRALRAFGDADKLFGSDRDPRALVKALKESGAAFPRIYMSCGTEDELLGANRAFHACLLENGVEHKYVEAPGKHDWDFWDADIRRILDWLPL